MPDVQHRDVEQLIRDSIAYILTETGEQLKDLTALLGHASATPVSRRQRGETAWEVRELSILAQHWQMPVTALLEGPDKAHEVLSPTRASELRHRNRPVAAAAA